MKVIIRPLMVALVLATSAAAAQEPPAVNADPTVIGQVEHVGYGLIGPRGRHYVFGGIAMADYSDSGGTRRIVTLQLEDQINNEQHVYYRELREGHRWAFSRKPGADGLYGVWIQLSSSDPAAKPKWQSFQRARLETPRDAARAVPTSVQADRAAPACYGR
jgi:hypothetical protein